MMILILMTLQYVWWWCVFKITLTVLLDCKWLTRAVMVLQCIIAVQLSALLLFRMKGPCPFPGLRKRQLRRL